MTLPRASFWRAWMLAAPIAAACHDVSDHADGSHGNADADATTDAVDDDGDSTDGGSTTGPGGSSGGASDEADASSESTGYPEIDCTEACVDTQSDVGVATCYSCRCLNALDGWLPSPDEVQCGTTPEIVTYRADVSTGHAVLDPIDDDANACANPSLLTGSCKQHSKLGQIQHGDVLLKWICRDPYTDAEGTIYADMGLIGHNIRTGATCYWDDNDNITHDDDMPPLDLCEADDATKARFVEVFYHTEGESCIECHDHDPFIYTPYLQATGWITTDHTKRGYSRTMLDGTYVPTGNKHLVSPQAAACTTCHRIGSRSTCSDFVRDSLGMDKALWTYETAVVDAAQPGSPNWRLAYWMPSLVIPTFEAWLASFSGARDHILSCCAHPGANDNGCMWADVPQ